jgi:uncharacterized protein (TIGR00661 family)
MKRILVCPLDWGLGHAARDVYIIKKLLKKNNEVILGGDGPSLKFLISEFPGLESFRIPSHKFVYSKILPAWFMILLQIPAFLKGIFDEHKILRRITNQYHIDLVISDTRYGLWNRQIPSIILTHQVRIRFPLFFKFLEFPVNYINLLALKKFTQLWIPDFPGYPNLSGILSHNIRLPLNSFYIGCLSRFTEYQTAFITSESYELVVLLSGPEPQRSVFEKIVTAQILQQNRKSLVIAGQTEYKVSEDLSLSCRRISFLSGDELFMILKSAKFIICRSGYSTIMDLVALGKTAFLVPTPGQPEQEYLACYLQQKGLFLFSKQKDFILEDAIQKLKNFKPPGFPSAILNFPDELIS